MYRINAKSNRIAKVDVQTFKALGYTERDHLQEWLANKPDALGEELLIIQKEFAGFDDTSERLDLLAIDKRGTLVIIENKLDDSGKDVVWQALKYTSYCSTLTKSQISAIFQQYLDKVDPGRNAQVVICEFLEELDFDEVVLNTSNDQRMILVAAHFRKEVTSTVLWLLGHRIQLKCFKATPFKHGDDEYLTIEQVIPFPSAEEHMIKMSEKEVQEQEQERTLAGRKQRNVDFWHATLDSMRDKKIALYEKVSPRGDHWLNAGSGLSGIYYSMVINKDEARVDFAFDRASKDENKMLFDVLYHRRSDFDNAFGSPLSWRRMEEKKVSLVEFAAPFKGHLREKSPEMIAWLVTYVRKLEQIFEPEISNLREMLKNRQESPTGGGEFSVQPALGNH